MSYATSLSPSPLLPNNAIGIDGAFLETTHILQRVGIAGMMGLGAGPLVIGKRALSNNTAATGTRKMSPQQRQLPPMWRMSFLGSVGTASASLPFLCMERLSYYSIRGNSSSIATTAVDNDSVRYSLYISHALGTILGAGLLRGIHQAVRKTKQSNHFPIRVMALMMCKAHVETILLKNEQL